MYQTNKTSKTFPILVVLLFTGVSAVFAQPDPQFNQHQFYLESINPATPTTNGVKVDLVARKQWLGFQGSPTSLYNNVSFPIKNTRSGIGLQNHFSRFGFERNHSSKVSYNYGFRLGKNGGTLHAGFALGIMSKRLDGLSGSSNPISENALKSDAGMHWTNGSKNAFAGITVTHLAGESPNKINIDAARNYWVYFSKFYQLNTRFSIKPYAMVQTDIISTQLFVSTDFYVDRMVYGGIGYRQNEQVTINAGYQKQNFNIKLSYGINTSRLSNYTSGSGEIGLGYRFERKPKEYMITPWF